MKKTPASRKQAINVLDTRTQRKRQVLYCDNGSTIYMDVFDVRCCGEKE